MSKEHLLEIQITQPGRVTGQYCPVDADTLRLENIVHPLECLPFDVGILPTALTLFDEPFSALLIGELSHPSNTEVESRLLGAIQRAEEAPILLVTATVDESAPGSLDCLTDDQRAGILITLNHVRPGKWRWLTVEDVEPYLHSAALRYRNKKAENRLPKRDPAWRPLHIGQPAPGFIEVERYTPAEYTFFELPQRFQHYVGEFLAPDERILYAARRPAMSGQRNRSWLRREVLQEGVLILTTQRLIHLAELVPPDSANIRYGFHTAIGALERLAGVTLERAGSNLVLHTDWQAKGGTTAIEWESPGYTRASLEELVSLLKKFQTEAEDCALRRAMLPSPPETIPPLKDTASNDPESMLPVNEHFSNALAESLSPGESAQAWALLPEWFQPQKGAQALVVTERRIFMLPDQALEIPLDQVGTLEYSSSILESALALNSIQNGSTRRSVILFPYPAQRFFRDCFEAARRCMAVLPLI